MRVNRLLEMVTLLLNREKVTAREFAERFQISTRTVYRDVDDLSLAGIPIYMNKGKGGGISLLNGYTLDKTMISPEEIDSLLLAVRTLQATQFPDTDRFLEKLEGYFQHPDSGKWIEVDYSPWGSQSNEGEKFNNIRQAILKKKEIHFDYINAEGKRSRRKVDPLQLIFKSQCWYLRGYCIDRQSFRTFRLSRIRSLMVTSQTFDPSKLPEIVSEGKNNDRNQSVSVKLRFSQEAAFRVYDDFDDRLINQDSNGSLIVTIDMVTDEWLYGLVLSYGHYVEVLEPESLRNVIAERLKLSLVQYL